MRKLLALALAWAICLAVPAYAEMVTAAPGIANVKFRGTRITSAQSITTGTMTRVQLNSIGIDTGGYWDAGNFQYKPLIAGTYEVCGSARTIVTNGTNMEVIISKNGTSGSGGTEIADVSMQFSATPEWAVAVPCSLVAMNGSTDTLELDVAVVGTTPTLSQSRSTTQMSIQLVGP